MKVYLDTCSIQRPLDNKDQARVALESEAVLAIITLCEAGRIELVSSEALIFESQRNVNSMRKEFAIEVLQSAKYFVRTDNEIIERANCLIEMGIMALDALHLASAEKIQADYFCTCDDKLLKKAKPLAVANLKVVSALELIGELEK